MNETSRWFKGNYALLMVVGCVVTIALVVAIFAFRIPLGSIAPSALILACPLMHLFMMRGMSHGNQHAGCHGETQPGQTMGKVESGLRQVGSGVEKQSSGPVESSSKL